LFHLIQKKIIYSLSKFIFFRSRKILLLKEQDSDLIVFHLSLSSIVSTSNNIDNMTKNDKNQEIIMLNDSRNGKKLQ